MYHVKKSAAALVAAAPAAQAEGKIRIAEQFGVVYLLLNVAQDQKLIEKHGKKHGVEIDVDWVRLSGGAATNDALLPNSVDVVGAGLGPLMTIWDRTNGKQNVRGIASLGNFPYYLISTNPAVKSIADFGPKDRIALPAVTVSVQARILLLSPHPGRVRAELDSHQFDLRSTGSVEFQAANERIHRLLFGGPTQSPQRLAVHA